MDSPDRQFQQPTVDIFGEKMFLLKKKTIQLTTRLLFKELRRPKIMLHLTTKRKVDTKGKLTQKES